MARACTRARPSPKSARQAAAPAPAGRPLELQSDFDSEDPELRMNATNMVGAFSLTSTLWPPKKLMMNNAEMSPVKFETTVGRYTGSAPPFSEWPFYEAKEVPPLEESAEELSIYRVVDFSKDVTRAFALASRWQKNNLGRSAGFSRMGSGKLSSFKFANPIMMRQLQGLNVLLPWMEERGLEELTPAELEEFLDSVEAGDFIRREFSAVAPVQRRTKVSGLVGSVGSALAVWTQASGGAVEVHFCLGHDCLIEGPAAEERLLRLLATGEGGAGAGALRCRARFTEKGNLVAPCQNLGFQLAAGEKAYEEDHSDEIAMNDPNFTKLKNYKDIPEAVPGLRTWLLLLCLEDRIEEANAWCHEMGAAELQEVIESREELADFLMDMEAITPGKQFLRKTRFFLPEVVPKESGDPKMRRFGRSYGSDALQDACRLPAFFSDAAAYYRSEAAAPGRLEAALGRLEQVAEEFRATHLESSAEDLQVDIAVLLESLVMGAHQALGEYKKMHCRVELVAKEYEPLSHMEISRPAFLPLAEEQVVALPEQAVHWAMDFSQLVENASKTLNGLVRELHSRKGHLGDCLAELRALLLRQAAAV
ncbi:unnamed protein product [Effrenium voratum]|nr:unnamed protein product [Effrenium voratum]